MTDEYISAVARFADDLWAVGIPQMHLDKAMGLYSTALFEPSEQSWTRFYHHVSELLQQRLRKAVEPGAARRLFAFVDDDFGRAVLELPIRTRLRELLLGHRIAS